MHSSGGDVARPLLLKRGPGCKAQKTKPQTGRGSLHGSTYERNRPVAQVIRAQEAIKYIALGCGLQRVTRAWKACSQLPRRLPAVVALQNVFQRLVGVNRRVIGARGGVEFPAGFLSLFELYLRVFRWPGLAGIV